MSYVNKYNSLNFQDSCLYIYIYGTLFCADEGTNPETAAVHRLIYMRVRVYIIYIHTHACVCPCVCMIFNCISILKVLHGIFRFYSYAAHGCELEFVLQKNKFEQGM